MVLIRTDLVPPIIHRAVLISSATGASAPELAEWHCAAEAWNSGVAHELSGPISRDIAILSLRYPISRDTF